MAIDMGRTAAVAQAGSAAGATKSLTLRPIEIPVAVCDDKIARITEEMGRMAKEGFVGSDMKYADSQAKQNADQLINIYVHRKTELLGLQNMYNGGIGPADRAAQSVAQAKAMGVKAGIATDDQMKGVHEGTPTGEGVQGASQQYLPDATMKLIRQEMSNPALQKSSEAVSLKAKHVDLARKSVQTAAIGLTVNSLEAMRAEVKGKKEEDEKKLETIKSKIENVGKTFSLVMGSVNKIMSGGMAGEALELGKSMAEHAEQASDADLMTNAKNFAGDITKGGDMVAEIVKGGMEIAYEGEINELKTRIGACETEINTITEVSAAQMALQRVEILSNAVEQYELALQDHTAAIQDRKAAYMTVAQHVDELLRSQGKEPAKNGDYASEMMLTVTTYAEAKSNLELAINAMSGVPAKADSLDALRGSKLELLVTGGQKVNVEDAAGGDATVLAAHQAGTFAAQWMQAAQEEQRNLNAVDPQSFGIKNF